MSHPVSAPRTARARTPQSFCLTHRDTHKVLS